MYIWRRTQQSRLIGDLRLTPLGGPWKMKIWNNECDFSIWKGQIRNTEYIWSFQPGKEDKYKEQNTFSISTQQSGKVDKYKIVPPGKVAR